MNPRQAQKLVRAMIGLDVLFVLAIVPLASKQAVDFFWTEPEKLVEEPSDELEPQEAAKPLRVLESFRKFWETDILEPMPTASVAREPQKKAKAKQQVKSDQIPFEWGGVMVHSQRKKSFAVLVERASKKQILVKHGETVKGTKYRVVSISQDEIRLGFDDVESVLKKPEAKSPFSPGNSSPQNPMPGKRTLVEEKDISAESEEKESSEDKETPEEKED